MKKFKKLAAVLIVTAATALSVAFGGCSLFERFFYSHPPLSDYVSATEINADSLMAVRTKIRAFNISVDTKYYRNMGWVSRTEGTSMGSGVIFEEDGKNYYALTNHHVITNVLEGKTYSVSYTVTDINGVEYTGKVVMSDSSKDIAIVSFSKKSTTNLGKANYTARLETNLTPGEFVLAVGNPSGVNNIVTYGQTVNWARIGNVNYSVIQHNALINPGNSGGALCDIDGNLLGLNTWGTENKDDENYSIPLSVINDYIDKFHASLSA